MEKIISQDERIRRAEEIYFNRKDRNQTRIPIEREKKKTKSKSYAKKMFLQILFSFFIYLIIFFIKSTENGFSDNILKQIENAIHMDMDFKSEIEKVQSNLYNINDELNKIIAKENKEDNKDKQKEVKEESTKKEDKDDVKNINKEDELKEKQEEGKNQEGKIEDNIEGKVEKSQEKSQEKNQEKDIENIDNPVDGIGGGIEEAEKTNLSQMEIDINYIKDNFDIILPLKGTITSRFGPRTPTKVVSANHCGLDIGAKEGTEIKSIIDGKVTQLSKKGDYGKHIKIENKDVSVLYAHCSELNVEEGQEIKKGDIISKVGSTGRATGPHLHIEIKRENRYVDPEKVLPF